MQGGEAEAQRHKVMRIKRPDKSHGQPVGRGRWTVEGNMTRTRTTTVTGTDN